MRSNRFTIPGNPIIAVAVSEQANGSLLFELSQSGSNIADIRGLFFDVTTPSTLSNLVITGANVTSTQVGDESVTRLVNDADVNMNGVKVSPFDVGIAFGTSGIGRDDIRSTSFVLSTSNGTPLTLDLISKVDFGVRLTSVGSPGSSRSDSQKNITVSTAAPNAIDDLIQTDEDTAKSGNLLANDTDADGDLLRVVQINGSNTNVGTTITLASGSLLTVNQNGSYTYNPNSRFESLGVGESAQESFTYRIFDGAFGYDTATGFVTVNYRRK